VTTPGDVSDHEVTLLRARYTGAHPQELIAWAHHRFPRERRVVVTGLQAEGVAVADMAIALDPTARVLTVDTGRLPEETHTYLDTLRAHWGRDIEVVTPAQAEVEAFASEHGANPFYDSTERRLECCHIRKVAPLQRALATVDCWMSGLRRGQSAGRAGTAVLEIDQRHGGIVKLNPLANWSMDEVLNHLRSRGIPTHPLYGKGYTSIGCAPCTRAVAPGEHPRAGRWWWEKGVDKECGIHVRPAIAVAAAS